ncbi:alpha/beta-hydrolase [Ceratobasidium sp. AG-I]|nr:alpha/beta-hydrolase [Ceratobasidium sp. AG-I]
MQDYINVAWWLSTGWLASWMSASSPIVYDSSGMGYAGLRNATSGQDYFLGIPFAQPPVGPLRFKPPVPWTSNSTAVVDATRTGHSCEQAVAGATANSVSEDCLTLNIWKPTDITEKLPVMVWIYGGGFYVGDIHSYPGKFLVERSTKIGKPVIYVAMNYRVGLYGFPPGQAAADAGAINLGLKDQRLALEWIQQNIEYFGGDPNKVILFGESAGAASAEYQSFYKGGDIGGAFRGMILESGSPTSLPAPKPDDPVREATFEFVVKATGCANSLDPFECVRSAPSDVLSQANKDVIKLEPYYQGPGQAPTTFGVTRAPNDDFIRDLPSALLREGKFAKVPFINGAQLDEGTLFVNGTSINTDQDIINWLTARFPGLYFGITDVSAIRELLKHYPDAPTAGSPYGTGDETFGQGAQYKRFASLFGDLLLQAPRRHHLRAAQKHGVPAWSYILSEGVPGIPPLFGTHHGGDIPFVFQKLDIDAPGVASDLVELEHTIGDYWCALSSLIMRLPGSFVRTR